MTAVPSASRWRRSWSNSPETSTVLFRWEKIDHTQEMRTTYVKGERRRKIHLGLLFHPKLFSLLFHIQNTSRAVEMLADVWAGSWWILYVVSSAELTVRQRSDGQLWRLAALSSRIPHHATGKLSSLLRCARVNLHIKKILWKVFLSDIIFAAYVFLAFYFVACLYLYSVSLWLFHMFIHLPASFMPLCLRFACMCL